MSLSSSSLPWPGRCVPKLTGSVVDPTLAPLRQSIINKPPYISGTRQLPPSWFSLFYKVTKDDNTTTNHIDLSNATFHELEQLTQACEPASFGKNKEEVTDEIYRKARKMDSECFATPLVPERAELAKIVRDYLLEGEAAKREIKLELYKLNVYDKESSLKPHVDTQRREDMFGSLVIVFPTAHEGGTLHLRHHGQEWTFNSGLELAGLRTPTIGYIAFFSDIEHEVAPVISGHRVTLTYNLYFYDKGPISKKDSTSEGNSYPPVAVNERAFRETLEDFLENPEFLAVGGTLGFGLRHIYPVSKSRMLRDIYNLLKGSDAAVFRSFKTLGFEPTLYMYYEGYSWQSDSTEAAIINNVMFSFNDTENPDIIQEIASRGGLVVWHKDHTQIDSKEKWANPEKVHWVTPVMEFNRQEGSYATYGNSPELKLVYGYLCLVVRIGKAGKRLAYPTIAQLQKERHRERSSVI